MVLAGRFSWSWVSRFVWAGRFFLVLDLDVLSGLAGFPGPGPRVLSGLVSFPGKILVWAGRLSWVWPGMPGQIVSHGIQRPCWPVCPICCCRRVAGYAKARCGRASASSDGASVRRCDVRRRRSFTCRSRASIELPAGPCCPLAQVHPADSARTFNNNKHWAHGDSMSHTQRCHRENHTANAPCLPRRRGKLNHHRVPACSRARDHRRVRVRLMRTGSRRWTDAGR